MSTTLTPELLRAADCLMSAARRCLSDDSARPPEQRRLSEAAAESLGVAHESAAFFIKQENADRLVQEMEIIRARLAEATDAGS